MSTSELFESVFTTAGSSVEQCGFCGVTHFCKSYMDEDDYEKICKERDAEPKKYVEHEWDGISWGYVDGKQFVPDCTCDGGEKVECFIWRNRREILRYLKARMEENARIADAELDLIS